MTSNANESHRNVPSNSKVLGGSGAPPFKRLANMTFNQHGGRSGTRSASSTANRMIRKEAERMGTVRPGPLGMGMINPAKPTKIMSGHEGQQKFSHLHQMHEKYNEK